MNNEEELIKKLSQAHAEIGSLKHKLKIRQNDRSDYNINLGKIKAELENRKDDLKLAYSNLEKMHHDLKALKRAFRILDLIDNEKQDFRTAMHR